MTRALLVSLLLSTAIACGSRQAELSGSIKIDGSSTVYPLTSAVAKAFAKPHPDVQIAVAMSGTSAGFERFCRADADIENASRPITAKERAACEQRGVSFVEVPVAQDAVTVIAHPSNDWVKSVTIAELKKMWEPSAEGKVMRWSDVNGAWPAEPLHLFGPGSQSGTFDFFTEAVVGETDASRRDYTASEDDEVIVKGVGADRLALGYVGLWYFERHKDTLRPVAVAGLHADRFGPVVPSVDSVRRGRYLPLSRTLFIYVNANALERPEVSAFVRFYIDQGESLVRSVGGVALSTRAYELVRQRVARRSAGTMFADGRPAENLELLLETPDH